MCEYAGHPARSEQGNDRTGTARQRGRLDLPAHRVPRVGQHLPGDPGRGRDDAAAADGGGPAAGGRRDHVPAGAAALAISLARPPLAVPGGVAGAAPSSASCCWSPTAWSAWGRRLCRPGWPRCSWPPFRCGCSVSTPAANHALDGPGPARPAARAGRRGPAVRPGRRLARHLGGRRPHHPGRGGRPGAGHDHGRPGHHPVQHGPGQRDGTARGGRRAARPGRRDRGVLLASPGPGVRAVLARARLPDRGRARPSWRSPPTASRSAPCPPRRWRPTRT